MTKIIEPSIAETAFNCPHCDVLTTQHWFDMRTDGGRTDPPSILYEDDYNDALNDENLRAYAPHIERAMTGEIFFTKQSQAYATVDVTNLHISQCHNCKALAIWLYNRLLYPAQRVGSPPNTDLDEDIRRDMEEARSIVDLSPRGAAALLRLALQKLCKQLGESGVDINRDIQSLVAKGLAPVIQRSLDIIRVIGNESVHPGELDLRDDRDTATQLLGIINTIANQMISHPKAVQELYDRLPEAKRKGIEARDAAGATKKAADK